MINYEKIKDRVMDNELFVLKLKRGEITPRTAMKALKLYVENLKQFDQVKYKEIQDENLPR